MTNRKKEGKTLNPWYLGAVYFLVTTGLIVYGIAMDQMWPFGAAFAFIAILPFLKSLGRGKLFDLNVKQGDYLFYGLFANLIFIGIVIIGGMEMSKDVLGAMYLVALGLELFFAAIIDPDAMSRKGVGQVMSFGVWLVMMVLYGLSLHPDFHDFLLFETLFEVPWQYFVIPSVFQIMEIWISSQLKPLKLRHFGDIDNG